MLLTMVRHHKRLSFSLVICYGHLNRVDTSSCNGLLRSDAVASIISPLLLVKFKCLMQGI